MKPSYKFNGKLWIYSGDAAWHFITLPKKYAREIAAISKDIARGFGSLRVTATIGDSSWKTSIFPDSRSGSYLLPVKKEIRSSEKLGAGDSVKISVTLTDI
ncbi:hypothetical protein A3A68_02180 [Candidatus Saccharibacteria bacterium RIFCSPLOWO2_01_FULL_48_13]|nr:MAG: hypothetical protein A3A68_02180 [Candidatus Saccharibacteria bacterium RIFCSPLOWO2_01_FULL_48_13]